MRRFSLSLLTSCFILFSEIVFAQTNDSLPANTFSVSFSENFGLTNRLYPSFPVPSPAFVSELNLLWQTRGRQYWHSIHHFPEIGIAVQEGYFGNKNSSVQNFALIPNLVFRKKTNRSFGKEIKIGTGISYFTFPNHNPGQADNVLLGSHVTNISTFNFSVWKTISRLLRISAGISLYHFSNGHYQLPNLGVNFPALDLSLKYVPSPETRFYSGDSARLPEKKIRYTVKFGYGLHEFGTPTNPTGGPKFPTYHISLYAAKRYKAASSFQAGVVLGYYTDFYDYIVSEQVYDSHEHLKASTLIVFAGHEYFFGRVGIVTQLGIYLYNPFFKAHLKMIGDDKKLEPQIKSYNSNRVSIQYYLLGKPEKTTANNLFIGWGIKANFGQADFVEWSLGYSF